MTAVREARPPSRCFFALVPGVGDGILLNPTKDGEPKKLAHAQWSTFGDPLRPSRYPTASRLLPSTGHLAGARLRAAKRAQSFIGGVPNQRLKAEQAGLKQLSPALYPHARTSVARTFLGLVAMRLFDRLALPSTIRTRSPMREAEACATSKSRTKSSFLAGRGARPHAIGFSRQFFPGLAVIGFCR